jgi:DNA-binding HxlR family transcriptional regulator
MTRRPRQEGTSQIPSNLHVPEDCRAVSEVLARVGDKWTVLVVIVLGDGTSCGAGSAAFHNGC